MVVPIYYYKMVFFLFLIEEFIKCIDIVFSLMNCIALTNDLASQLIPIMVDLFSKVVGPRLLGIFSMMVKVD